MSYSADNINEEKTVNASYIIAFYQEVENLNHSHAQYINLMIELDNTYDLENDDKKNLDDTQKNVIKESVQQLRYHITRCYIKYESLINNIKKEENNKEKEEIKELYSKAKKEFILETKTSEEIVLFMNKVITRDILKNLLETSQDIIETITNTVE